MHGIVCAVKGAVRMPQPTEKINAKRKEIPWQRQTSQYNWSGKTATHLQFWGVVAKQWQKQDGLIFGTTSTRKQPPGTTTTSLQRYATTSWSMQITEQKKTEKSTAPATGLFLIYVSCTKAIITPRLAPIAADSPRVPPGRFSRYAIIALWAVSGQTWAFLLSHTHLRCPIIINAYFQLLSRHSTCYFCDLCCRK